MSKSEQSQSNFDILNENISSTRVGVEREFAKGGNPWLSCFGSRLFQVETYLSMNSIKNSFSEEKYKQIESKFNELKEKFFDLKEQYEETLPETEVREELVTTLENILAD